MSSLKSIRFNWEKSRNGNTHFGIGLYIAETIVKLHKGTLYIENSALTGGGQVTIEIPTASEPPHGYPC